MQMLEYHTLLKAHIRKRTSEYVHTSESAQSTCTGAQAGGDGERNGPAEIRSERGERHGGQREGVGGRKTVHGKHPEVCPKAYDQVADI